MKSVRIFTVRIGIITHNYPVNSTDRQNAGIFVYDFAQGLQDLGHEVFVLSCGKRIEREKSKPQTSWFSWPGSGKKLGDLKMFNPVDLLSFFLMLVLGCVQTEKFIQKNKIDFVIGMWTVPAGLFSLWANLRQKIPYSLWSLGSDTYVYSKYPVLGNLIKLALKRAGFLLADGIDLARQTGEIAGRSCQFLPSASKMSKQIQITVKKSGPLKFMFLGRMESVKGPDVLIEAIAKIKDLDFELHLLGDGSLLPSLKDKIKTLGLEKKVIFYGNVNDPKIIFQRLLSSDWLVIPSRSDSIPLAFSESMKASLPVIVAKVGDMAELVDKYKVGFSFPKEDSQKLSAILKELIKKGREDSKSYQQRTKETATVFDINTSARRLAEMIKLYG